MHKLIILIESTTTPGFHDFWPRFLHAAENIPGLRRESTSRISQVLYGDVQYALVHELYFDTLSALQAGLASPSGKEAGRLLQELTGGSVNLINRRSQPGRYGKYPQVQENRTRCQQSE